MLPTDLFFVFRVGFDTSRALSILIKIFSLISKTNPNRSAINNTKTIIQHGTVNTTLTKHQNTETDRQSLQRRMHVLLRQPGKQFLGYVRDDNQNFQH